MDPAAKKAKTEEALAMLDLKTEAEAGRVRFFFLASLSIGDNINTSVSSL